MLFTKKEIEILNDMNCYENKEKLVKSEIDLDNLSTYTMNDKYWNKSLNEWFIDYFEERIYSMVLYDDTKLYFFDNSDDDIDCDRYKLIDKLFDNYEITTSEDFDEVIIKLEDESENNCLSDEDKEILRQVFMYDDSYDLAKEWHGPKDIRNYASSFNNFKDKFDNWFIKQEDKCVIFLPYIYAYINLEDMTYEDKRDKIINRIADIIDRYDVSDADEYNEFIKKYVEE